jgi:uncharacterized protein (TIGR04141 family)
MKRNVVAFLGKESLEIHDLLNKDRKRSIKVHSLDSTSPNNFTLCIEESNRPADWAYLFESYGIEQSDLLQRSFRAALFVKVNNRYVIFTFGYGGSLLSKSAIERGFGLRVSMNLGNPLELRSIDKTTLDRVARNTRSQVTLKSSIQDFDFEFDHEILKSITATIDRPDKELETVSGYDSVSLYTDLDFNKFQSISDRIFSAYNSKEYKSKYPWAEFIRFENDPEIIDFLESKLIEKLNSNDIRDFWLAPSKIIDYQDFSGFVYSKKRNDGNSFCKQAELRLDSFLNLSNFHKPISINALKNKEIYLYNSNDQEIDNFKAINCLNGEIYYNDEPYILNEGRWYSIKKSFSEEIEAYFSKMTYWNGLEKKPYHDKRECCYLRRIADNEEVAVLDQHWVQQNDLKQNYEFSDLITQCNRIIHVKRYGGSSVLSHLLAQATMGVDLMLNCPEVVLQVQDHLSETYVSFNFQPEKPREHTIVLAIIQANDGPIHLPFFTKVNLRYHARNIENKGFNIELAKIPVDKIKLSDLNKSEPCKCKPRACPKV